MRIAGTRPQPSRHLPQEEPARPQHNLQMAGRKPRIFGAIRARARTTGKARFLPFTHSGSDTRTRANNRLLKSSWIRSIYGAIRARARTTGSNDTVFMRRASGSDTRTRANNRALPYVHTARSQGAIRARARTTGVELQSIRHWPAGAIRARARTTGLCAFDTRLGGVERYAHAREQQAPVLAFNFSFNSWSDTRTRANNRQTSTPTKSSK